MNWPVFLFRFSHFPLCPVPAHCALLLVSLESCYGLWSPGHSSWLCETRRREQTPLGETRQAGHQGIPGTSATWHWSNPGCHVHRPVPGRGACCEEPEARQGGCSPETVCERVQGEKAPEDPERHVGTDLDRVWRTLRSHGLGPRWSQWCGPAWDMAERDAQAAHGVQGVQGPHCEDRPSV